MERVKRVVAGCRELYLPASCGCKHTACVCVCVSLILNHQGTPGCLLEHLMYITARSCEMNDSFGHE